MDLSLAIIGALAFTGYKLNDEKQPRKRETQRSKISPHETPSGKNIYHSTYSKEIKSKERKLANTHFEKSKDPVNTNIIPPLYNTYCKWDCEKPASKPRKMKKQNTILPSVEKTSKNFQKNKEIQIFNGPMFKESKVEVKGFDILSDKTYTGGFDNSFIENFDNMSSLTGQKMEMKHNNLVPFFGSNVKQNTQIERNSSLLENFTGNFDTPMMKKEVPKMFLNQKENIYGTRPSGDLISQNRFIASSNKTSLKPVPEIKVQPLPQEYVRPVYKTTDELRVKTKPKVSYKNHAIKGSRYVTNRGKIGQVNKNRPDTFYVNDQDKYLTTTGSVIAPTIRENFDPKYTPKADTSERSLNISPAYNSELNKGKPGVIRENDLINKNIKGLYTIVDDDHRHSYKQDWVRNPTGEIKLQNAIDRDSYIAYEQERETTSKMHILPASATNRGYHQSHPTQAKTTNKESNLYSHLGVASGEVEKITDYSGAYNYTKERQYINNFDYKGTPSRTNIGKYNKTQYVNLTNFGKREGIMDTKGYTAGGQKENTPLGSQGVNAYLRDDSLRKNKYEYNSNVNRVVQTAATTVNIGSVDQGSRIQLAENDYKDRVDPDLLKAFRQNPYTQSLSSI